MLILMESFSSQLHVIVYVQGTDKPSERSNLNKPATIASFQVFLPLAYEKD